MSKATGLNLPESLEAAIEAAISQSQSHDTIVTIDCPAAQINEAVAYITDVRGFDGDHDSVDTGDLVEVWGWTNEMPENEMAFRVHLRKVSE